MATEVKKPTTFTEGALALWTNESNAYDIATGGDETTFAYQTLDTDEIPSIRFHTWGTKGQTYTETILYMKWKTSIQTGDDQVHVEYTKNGGGAWADLLANGINRSVAYSTAQITLDANQDLTQVEVRVSSDKVKGADGCDFQISDIWTEGEYTASATEYQNAGQGAVSITGSIVRQTSKFPGNHNMSIAGSIIRQTSKFPGNHSMSTAGVLSRKGFKDTGGYAINILGTLVTASIFLQSVGGHAMTIAGILNRVTTYIRVMGNHAMAITGTLIKKTSVFPGGYVMTIFGILSKGLLKELSVGGYSISIAGTLSTSIVIGQNVGGYALSIIGILTKKISLFPGKYIMNIIGSLTKGSFKNTGGYSMSISGEVKKKTSKDVGNYAVVIIGSLVAAAKYVINVGGYALSLVGSLATQFTAGTGVVITKFIRRRKTVYKQ